MRKKKFHYKLTYMLEGDLFVTFFCDFSVFVAALLDLLSQLSKPSSRIRSREVDVP